MRFVPCNLCGADDFTVVFPRGHAQAHRIVRCRRCGLMYANPQEMVDCDGFAADGAVVPHDPGDPAHRQYFTKQLRQLPDNVAALHALDALLPGRGRLLEIGCYLGVFLDRIRADGWDAVGLEPDRAVAAYARATYGLNVVDSLLPQAGFPDGSFDAVVMLHVIEHLPDPSATLREIRRIIRPAGILVVETPRFDSMMFRVFGRRERSVSNTSGHIFFFTAATLREMLARNGFAVVRTEFTGRTLTLDRLLTNAGIMSRSDRVKRWLGRFSANLGLDRVCVHVNVRDMQRVYCRAQQTVGASGGAPRAAR